ncbi:hypothetical protein L0Y65_06830 [Candidatus Micrarchaeota archaeon]|nr:hypothetical protein [Candidatus Micrarchaeota archaeon]
MVQARREPELQASSVQMTPMQRYNEAQRIVVRQLQGSGYTEPEAREAVRLARSMISFTPRQPKPEPLTPDNPLHRRISERLLIQVRDTLVQAYQSEESLGMVTAGRLYARPERGISMAMVPAPVTEFRFRFHVDVAGQSYTVDSNQPLNIGGVITRPDQTDAGRLMALLDNRNLPNSDLRIADASGNLVSRAAFSSIVRPNYRRIQQEFAQANVENRTPDMGIVDSVDVSRVRRPAG